MSRRLGQLRWGLTLLECMMASVVLAISVFAVTLPFTVGARNEEVQQRRTVAVALAQEMMEEILSKPFSDPQGLSMPGPETDEYSRWLFDNIDDYDSLYEYFGMYGDTTMQPVSDPAMIGLSRHVTTKYVYVSGQQTDQPPTFIRVTVEVRYESTPMVALTRLILSRE